MSKSEQFRLRVQRGDSAFETMAEKYNLDLNRNEHNYLNYTTQMAYEFYMARQPAIDRLEHDLASEKCACNIFQHLAGKKFEKENQG
jgi:hypothetical protein